MLRSSSQSKQDSDRGFVEQLEAVANGVSISGPKVLALLQAHEGPTAFLLKIALQRGVVPEERRVIHRHFEEPECSNCTSTSGVEAAAFGDERRRAQRVGRRIG